MADYEEDFDDKAADDKIEISQRLRQEFFQFSIVTGCNKDLKNYQDVNEDIMIKLLGAASKRFKFLNLRSDQAIDSEEKLLQRNQGHGIINLKEEPYLTKIAFDDDTKAMKKKIVDLIEFIRCEKDARLEVERQNKQLNKTIKLLNNHIEKLMGFLKQDEHEKERLRRHEYEVNRALLSIRQDSQNKSREIASKDRLISKLKAGSALLEEQMKLMEEKILEFQRKSLSNRLQLESKVTRYTKEIDHLRSKLLLTDYRQMGTFLESGSNGSPDRRTAFECQRPSTGKEDRPGSANGTSNRRPMSAAAISRVGRSAKDIKVEKAMIKLRRMRGDSAVDEWTDEKARMLAYSTGCIA